MRLSVAIAGKNAPGDAFVVMRGFEDSIEKAKELGFDGVELALKDGSELNPRRLEKTLTRTSMEVSCISTGQVFAVSGLYFTHPDHTVREKTLTVFKSLIDLAADFGGLVNIGRVRGQYAPDQSRQETENLFVELCRSICDHAARKNVSIILEPVNRYEVNFINSVEDGARLVDVIGRDNLGLMPDTFHMNIEDVGIGRTLARFGAYIKYVHFADSNRLAPGQGHIDFDEVMDGLYAASYNGWISLEILPEPDSYTAAQRAAEYVVPLIHRYNAWQESGRQDDGLPVRR